MHAVFPPTAYRTPIRLVWFKRSSWRASRCNRPVPQFVLPVQALVGEELKQPVGAAILSPQPSSQPVSYECLVVLKHVRAVAIMKRRRPTLRIWLSFLTTSTAGWLRGRTSSTSRTLSLNFAWLFALGSTCGYLRLLFMPCRHATVKPRNSKPSFRVSTNLILSSLSFYLRASSHHFSRVCSPAP